MQSSESEGACDRGRVEGPRGYLSRHGASGSSHDTLFPAQEPIDFPPNVRLASPSFFRCSILTLMDMRIVKLFPRYHTRVTAVSDHKTIAFRKIPLRPGRTRVYEVMVSTNSRTVFLTGFISGNPESRNKVTSRPKLFSISFCVRCCFSERSYSQNRISPIW